MIEPEKGESDDTYRARATILDQSEAETEFAIGWRHARIELPDPYKTVEAIMREYSETGAQSEPTNLRGPAGAERVPRATDT